MVIDTMSVVYNLKREENLCKHIRVHPYNDSNAYRKKERKRLLNAIIHIVGLFLNTIYVLYTQNSFTDSVFMHLYFM